MRPPAKTSLPDAPPDEKNSFRGVVMAREPSVIGLAWKSLFRSFHRRAWSIARLSFRRACGKKCSRNRQKGETAALARSPARVLKNGAIFPSRFSPETWRSFPHTGRFFPHFSPVGAIAGVYEVIFAKYECRFRLRDRPFVRRGGALFWADVLRYASDAEVSIDRKSVV